MQRKSASEQSAPPPSAWVITGHQRDPPSFAGLRREDVEDWLHQYNRVSQFNRWDDAFKLRDVPFHLDLVAKTWYFNNEATFENWTDFTQRLRKAFGTPSARVDGAKKDLGSRVQRPDETYAAYIEDVLALSRRVDQSMPEADKVRHILKGIASFAFNALAIQNPLTVSDVRETCQRLDQLQSLRLQPEPAPLDGNTDLRTLIRAIIREELGTRTSPCLQRDHCHHSPSPLRDLFKEELASMTAYPPANSTPRAPYMTTYAEAASKHPLFVESPPLSTAPGHLTAIAPSRGTQAYYAHVRPDRQLFPRDRPVCYYCGIRGHISRFCRRRQQDERRGYAPDERDNARFAYGTGRSTYVPPNRRSSPPRDSPEFSQRNTPTRRRSPSPYRRSLSPLRPASLPNNDPSGN